jgi:hypothetical protein
MIRPLTYAAAVRCAAAAVTPARAQRAAPAALSPSAVRADRACTYASCGLWIAQRRDGLEVVRGDRRGRAASLNFFWPRDVRASFAGSDSAVHSASRARRLRRLGAALTDLGGVALALGAAQIARRGDLDGPGGRLAVGGIALLGASVPAQVAADGELSRAVWWYNARFGR